VAEESKPTQSWIEHQDKLLSLARRKLFLVGGAPRSGTTWLQYVLDSHPDVCCRGEGHFLKSLAEQLEKVMMDWRQALDDKNKAVFRHAIGYPLPEPEDTDFLIGTAVLLALERQCAGKSYHAVGEKTPENVFFFPRIKRLFPHAKFICIARDPRDLLSSAWHFFHKPTVSGDERTTKIAFIRRAIQGLQLGTRSTLALKQQYPSDCMIITYEHMLATTAAMAAGLFRFLGVSDRDDIVADCVARTSFAALTGGRPAGQAQDGSFFRKGVVGDWHSTLTPEMNEMILQELGWMFPIFGWKP
jgi:Sulfotransferase family